MSIDPLIPPHGGYRDLKFYQMAEIISDATVVFCDRVTENQSRTRWRDRSESHEREGKAPRAWPVEGATQAPQIAANAALCLIHQANYLLDQQLRALEKGFLDEGGFTERLYRVRSQTRREKMK